MVVERKARILLVGQVKESFTEEWYLDSKIFVRVMSGHMFLGITKLKACHMPAMWPWIHYATSLSNSF